MRGMMRLLALLEARGVIIVLLALLVGALASVLVTAMNHVVQFLHGLLFETPPGGRLSAMMTLQNPLEALVPAVGGILLGLSIVWLRWRKFRTPVDPIEANALHGGRMSLTDTCIIAGQTMLSSGFGASVGLEAGYTQVGSGLASYMARFFRFRRGDVRILVGAGAAGAIAAAFDAPLTGAFYGFELIIGIYSIANVAPVMAAAITASLVATWLGGAPFPIDLPALPALTASQYVPFILLGLCGGAISIGIMYLVAGVERVFVKLSIPAAARPFIGGCIVGMLGLVTPQVLSSGHGALHSVFSFDHGLFVVGTIFLLKIAASSISLGAGFRGGLFFASLLLGALFGKLFAGVTASIAPFLGIDPVVAAVAGMTSFAVGIVGGPLTMTFLALESTHDLALSGVVLATSVMTSLLVRETFGYSFSTWRFHLRGETIRSAQDVGWMRNLTVGAMMRKNVETVEATTTIGSFCVKYPLGAAQRVIAVDEQGHYAGMLIVAEVHGHELGPSTPVSIVAKYKDVALVPHMDVSQAANAFQDAGAEELAVIKSAEDRTVIGLLTENHLMRRYAEELEKARRDLAGEK
ncbi:CIC family chloride channel protein [Beijerinckia sp. GAS462]|nr:CIC family chloride channel protein [Beijerinckia sp. GAS462]SED18033.1 chloride channel protein, CIC family [Beijerinckia sp. 28-YEA-48]